MPQIKLVVCRQAYVVCWSDILVKNDEMENIVGKGESACYEQFLLFPQCFQKLSSVDTSKSVFIE